MRVLPIALVVLSAVACGSLTGPSDTPPVSRLYFDKPPDAVSGAHAGRWAATNASFAARVFTSCEGGAAAPADVCPSLMVWVQPAAGGWCQLLLYAPEGDTLAPRAYPRAERFPAPGVAGMGFSCDRAACDSLEGNFTVHRLAVNSDQVITELHTTFEQTCRHDGQRLGRLTGELWIVKGTSGAPLGFPGG